MSIATMKARVKSFEPTAAERAMATVVNRQIAAKAAFESANEDGLVEARTALSRANRRVYDIRKFIVYKETQAKMYRALQLADVDNVLTYSWGICEVTGIDNCYATYLVGKTPRAVGVCTIYNYKPGDDVYQVLGHDYQFRNEDEKYGVCKYKTVKTVLAKVTGFIEKGVANNLP
jgi:hypothetical protein